MVVLIESLRTCCNASPSFLSARAHLIGLILPAIAPKNRIHCTVCTVTMMYVTCSSPNAVMHSPMNALTSERISIPSCKVRKWRAVLNFKDYLFLDLVSP